MNKNNGSGSYSAQNGLSLSIKAFPYDTGIYGDEEAYSKTVRTRCGEQLQGNSIFQTP